MTIQLGTVSVPWSEVTSITLRDRGVFNGHWVELETAKSGLVELQLLQPNATAKLSEASSRKCLEVLRLLRAGGLAGADRTAH